MVDQIRTFRLLTRVSDNSEAMTFLHRHGVIDARVETAMRKAIGLRNVLVHEYIGVDDAIVLNRVEDLSDLHRYVRQVTDWLQAGAQQPSEVVVL